MKLEKILAISGKPGLYELKVQTRTGFVAESMTDGKRITVGMKSNVSLLSEISVYTYTAEKPLSEILIAIGEKENGKPALSHKEANNVLLEYFIQIVPDYDQDRVYPSDIKKILNWYNTLQAKGLIELDNVAIENTPESNEQGEQESVADKKPKTAKVK